LAELLGWPHAAYVTKLDIQPDKLVVRRELEGGFLDVKELPKPAVVTIQTGGNNPRYASIMGIKRAGAKPIDQVAPEKTESKTQLIRLYVPEVTSAAKMFEGSTEEKATAMARLLKRKERCDEAESRNPKPESRIKSEIRNSELGLRA